MTVVAVLTAAAGTILWNGKRPAAPAPTDSRVAAKADTVWYHASNVAMRAMTGRPQLAVFVHPN